MRLDGKFIAIFVYCLRGGGAERVAAYVANGLAAQGDRVAVVTELGPETDLYPLDPAVERIVVGQAEGGGWLGKALSLARKTWNVRAFLKTHAPDVLISFMTRSNNIALAANLGLPGRVVIAERNDPRYRAEPFFDRTMRRLLYPRADLVVAQTAAIEAVVRQRFKARRTACIPNPCVAEPAAPDAARPHGRDYVLAMGRLYPQKGFDILIQAYAASQAARQADLVIAGQGPELDSLRALAAASGVADRVVFPGHVADPVPLMAHCELFVLSSRYEGFPNVLLEAMSHGRPVVSTRLPSGAHDFIEDGVSGLLVPVEDAAGLAAAIDRLISDEPLRRRLGEAARGAVERFSLPRIVARWRDAALGPAPAH